MSTIEHSRKQEWPHYAGMKSKELTSQQMSSVPCTICGAAIGEVCELHTGAPGTEPHRDRKLSAAEAVEAKRKSNRSRPGKAREGRAIVTRIRNFKALASAV